MLKHLLRQNYAVWLIEDKKKTNINTGSIRINIINYNKYWILIYTITNRDDIKKI